MKSLRIFKRFRRNRRILYAIFMVAFILHIGLQNSELLSRNTKHWIMQEFEKVSPYSLKSLRSDTQKHTINSFHYNWLRIHRARTDWRALLDSCSDQIAWGTSKSGWGKVNRSSAKNSYISYMDIQPSGQFSRIFIQTRTTNGQDKIIGGDFWRVFFTGPASVSATVFDHQNGTYEAMALLVEPGTYSIRGYLDYSLCDGLRDPPEDWFRVGNSQGKYQAGGTLGFLDEYLYEPLLGGRLITVQILPRNSNSHVRLTPEFTSTIRCKKSCRSLWDGHGRWKAGLWSSYIPGSYKRLQTKKSRRSRGTLWIFGDSIGCRLYRSLAKKSLCNETFNSCRCSYNWIYPVPDNNITLGRLLNDDFDFRPEIVLNSLRKVLHHDAMKHRQSLLVVNLGLHYPISINFTTFQNLIDDIVQILGDRERGVGPRIIWKTTTSMHKEKAELPRNVTHFRFSTEQRVRLFDAYAMSVMCNAGLDVLDVYPLSASYPLGTVDITHYNEEVFFAAEAVLEQYVLTGNTRTICVG